MDDTGVEYRRNAVFIGGQQVIVEIYGDILKAVDHFKHLGLVVNSMGTAQQHIQSRVETQNLAVKALQAGLAHIFDESPQFLLLFVALISSTRWKLWDRALCFDRS